MSSVSNKKPLEKSRIFNRLKITSNEEFTIPETASLFCSGGGIFRKGIAMGSSKSIIPGSIRFLNDKLQYLKFNGWLNITGFFEQNCRENSIVKFGSDGELEDTDILIENNDITGVNLIETEYIIPPDDKNINITNNNDINLTTTGDGNINLSTTGDGNINLNTTFVDLDGKLNIVNTNNDQKITFLSSPPLTSTSIGSKGDYAWDDTYIYMCVADNMWKRTMLSSW